MIFGQTNLSIFVVLLSIWWWIGYQSYCMLSNSTQSSFIRQKRMNMQHSRGSSTFNEYDTRLNTSFDFDSSMIESFYNRNLSGLSVVAPVRTRIAERQVRQDRPEQIRRNYLTRILINRMLNVRGALKRMEKLPEELFKKGPSFDIAKAAVMKGRVNLETSVLRTLLFGAAGSKQCRDRLRHHQGNDVFVLPSSQHKGGNQREAILKLSEIVKQYIRGAVKQFQRNSKQGKTIRRYLVKVYTRFVGMRKQAFGKLRMLPGKVRGVDLQSRIEMGKVAATLLRIQSKCLKLVDQAWTRIFANASIMKCQQAQAAKTIVTYSRLRKQQALNLWKHIAFSLKEAEEHEIQIEQAKIAALRRIVQRNYLKLLKQISRRVYIIKKVAMRLGCNSRLNQQKVLWRLSANVRCSQI